MSYYYDDGSYYSYTDTVPTHYEDSSTYSYSVPTDYYPNPEPTYYHDPPSDPIYQDDFSPEPTYCDDDLVYHDNDTQTELAHFDDATAWSSPPPPMTYEVVDEDELEAYAEAASNRTYFEDEIHPAYRDNPINGNDSTESLNTFEPPDIETYPVNHAHPTDSNHEDSSDSEHHWEEYAWTTLEFDGGIIKYDPPTNPTFYIPSSHDHAPDDDLTQSVERIGLVLDDYREWFTREADDHDLIEEWTPHVDRLSRVSQHMEEILIQRRMERDMMDEVRKVCDDIDSDPQSQLTSPSHHDFCHTSLPDICIPAPLPLSPNIWSKPAHLTSAFLITALKCREPRYDFGPPLRRRRRPNFRNATRTNPAPDIRLPKPHPLSPNIRFRLRPHLLANRHPPDTLPPTPIPPKPNILFQPTYQQPRRPPHIRPRRKHPPARLPITPTPQNCHRSARRRISRKPLKLV